MMKQLSKFAFITALAGITLLSCKEKKSEDSSAGTTPEATMASEEAAPLMAQNVLNVNLATEAELQEKGLAPEVVAAIMEKMPLMDMKELDALLGEGVDKSALYKTLFIPMNLNTTAEEDFKMIPGVGDRMAHEFEEYRPYTSVAQFKREIGKYVDEDEVARYLNYVFVPVELNTASEEDIKALPGVGDRMAHEFEEYRPYTSMEQFRKEIGKYVDDKELARLERLVYLKD